MNTGSTPSGRMKLLREEKHLTQKEVSDKIHCHVKHYSSMENGKRSITRETANALAHLYGVDEAWILCESNYRNSMERRAALEERLYNTIIRSDSLERLIEEHGYEIAFDDDIGPDGFLESSYSVEIRNSSARCRMTQEQYLGFRKSIEDLVEAFLILAFRRGGANIG